MDPRVTVSGKPVGEISSSIRRTPILVGTVAVLLLAVAEGIWQFYMRRPSVDPAVVKEMPLHQLIILPSLCSPLKI
jgi:hypothetical protein